MGSETLKLNQVLTGLIELISVIPDDHYDQVSASLSLAATNVKSSSSVGVAAGVDNFMTFVMRTSARACTKCTYIDDKIEEKKFILKLNDEGFANFKTVFLQRANQFVRLLSWIPRTIANSSLYKIGHPEKILVVGYTSHVRQILPLISPHLRVVYFPREEDYVIAREDEWSLHVRVLVVSKPIGVQLVNEVDLVLVGADGVDKEGGIITYRRPHPHPHPEASAYLRPGPEFSSSDIATIAFNARKPLFVVAASYMFGAQMPENGKGNYEYISPHQVITIISDRGCFSPCEISAELPKLYDGIFPFAEEPAVDAVRPKTGNIFLPSASAVDAVRPKTGNILLPSASAVDAVRPKTGNIFLPSASAVDAVRPKTGNIFLPSESAVDAVRPKTGNIFLPSASAVDAVRPKTVNTFLPSESAVDAVRPKTGNIFLPSESAVDAVRPKTGNIFLPSASVVGQSVFEKTLYYSMVEASATVRTIPAEGRYRTRDREEMMENDRRAKKKHAEAWAVAKQRGGYTREEFRLVGYYLPKREFESLPEPLPWPYRQYKKFLDQIRDTRGYGLTVPTPAPVPGEDANSRPPIVCVFDKRPFPFEEWMEDMVVGEILKKTGKQYVVKSMANLVMCKFIYLVSYHVAAAAPPEEEEEEEEAQTAEAIFNLVRHALTECKLRKGQEVLFSTAQIFTSPDST